jgi:hypothetical protein
VSLQATLPKSLDCVPNCGDDSRIPQARHVSRRKRNLQLAETWSVGAWPRFVQLASDDSYCGTCPVASKSPCNITTFCLCLPQIPGQDISPSRVPSRRVVDPPGTGLEVLCLCSRPTYRFCLFRFTIPAYHQLLINSSHHSRERHGLFATTAWDFGRVNQTGNVNLTCPT